MADKEPLNLVSNPQQSPEVCDCKGHLKENKCEHAVPCCSECPFCHQNIKMDIINDHVSKGVCSSMAVTDGTEEAE